MRIFVLLAAAIALSLSAGFARAETPAQPTANAAPDAPRLELAAFPQPGKLTYSIVREGSRIGSQVTTFQRNGDSLTVQTTVNIKVTLLGITIYRFDHIANEEWKAGELAHLTSKTNDDGDDRVVDLKLVDGKLKGTYNGMAKEFPAGVIPASLWHPGTVKQTQLLDQVKARYRQITVKDVGIETISIRGQKVKAHHYSMTGQIKRELWYGPEGRLEMMQFSGKDGSEIIVTLL
jgi:uncharacterized protein DUF6134